MPIKYIMFHWDDIMRKLVKELLPYVTGKSSKKNVSEGIKLLSDYAAGKTIDHQSPAFRLLQQKLAMASDINRHVEDESDTSRKRRILAGKVSLLLNLINAETCEGEGDDGKEVTYICHGVTVGTNLNYILNTVYWD